MSIHPASLVELMDLFGAFDGQKFEAMTPTTKARHSKKYFAKGKGVVAFTLLSNHLSIQSEAIGIYEHESYFAFDVWYKNISLIQPTILTGNMHSRNKANFAIFYWFGADLRPRLKNLKAELGNVHHPEIFLNFGFPHKPKELGMTRDDKNISNTFCNGESF